MSLKAKIKSIAETKGVTSQQVLQNYLIEAFLTKLAKSKYCKQFIIKGGYLIGGIVGIDLRTTMDVDITIKDFNLSPETIETAVKEIIRVPSNESFSFSFSEVNEIREMDYYPGYRVKLIAEFDNIREVVLIDFTTGDAITPKEINFRIRKVFTDESIELMSYPLETVLAEKLETILSRGIATTRPRDFYDVYLISKLKKKQFNMETLKLAFENTKLKRQSTFNAYEYNLIIKDIQESSIQSELWKKYQRQFRYARGTSFDELMEGIHDLLSEMFDESIK